jgi:hypothetical protein
MRVAHVNIAYSCHAHGSGSRWSWLLGVLLVTPFGEVHVVLLT